ncbi:hypothetical protein Bca4012_045338 [Brassica carinata]
MLLFKLSPKSSSTVCLYFLYIDVRNEDTFVLHTENSKKTMEAAVVVSRGGDCGN